jgi:hypothetical protein
MNEMIGGPFKPFFGLSGVHFQVAENHFRRIEPRFPTSLHSTTATYATLQKREAQEAYRSSGSHSKSGEASGFAVYLRLSGSPHRAVP